MEFFKLFKHRPKLMVIMANWLGPRIYRVIYDYDEVNNFVKYIDSLNDYCNLVLNENNTLAMTLGYGCNAKLTLDNSFDPNTFFQPVYTTDFAPMHRYQKPNGVYIKNNRRRNKGGK